MSDSLAAFEAKTRAMFATRREQVVRVSKRFIINVMTEVVAETPGTGNQKPPETLYQPTGRLRGGWRASLTPGPALASRWDDGPYDHEGVDTVDRIEAALDASPVLPAEFHVFNDVAYGFLVMYGKGRHEAVGLRPWVQTAWRRASFHYSEAAMEVFGGNR